MAGETNSGHHGLSGSLLDKEAQFERLIARRFDEGGPAAKIDDESGTAQTLRDPALIRQCFMRGLVTGRAIVLDGSA